MMMKFAKNFTKVIKFLKHIKKEVNYVQFLIKNGIITQTLGRVKNIVKQANCLLLWQSLNKVLKLGGESFLAFYYKQQNNVLSCLKI